MARKRKGFLKGRSLRDYKIVCRPSSTALKCAVIATVALSTVTLLTLRASLQDQQEKKQQLRQQAILLEQENKEIRQDIDELGSLDSVKDIASSQLGLADPDTTFFSPEEKTDLENLEETN